MFLGFFLYIFLLYYMFLYFPFILYFYFLLVAAPLNRVTWNHGAIKMLLLLLLLLCVEFRTRGVSSTLTPYVMCYALSILNNI